MRRFTPRQAIAITYADALRETERAHACEHGHPDCALQDGGPCVDELFAVAGLNNDGQPIEEPLTEE